MEIRSLPAVLAATSLLGACQTGLPQMAEPAEVVARHAPPGAHPPPPGRGRRPPPPSRRTTSPSAPSPSPPPATSSTTSTSTTAMLLLESIAATKLPMEPYDNDHKCDDNQLDHYDYDHNGDDDQLDHYDKGHNGDDDQLDHNDDQPSPSATSCGVSSSTPGSSSSVHAGAASFIEAERFNGQRCFMKCGDCVGPSEVVRMGGNTHPCDECGVLVEQLVFCSEGCRAMLCIQC